MKGSANLRKRRYFSLAVFLICLLVISGCRANTTDIEIAQIDEIAREIIYSYNASYNSYNE